MNWSMLFAGWAPGPTRAMLRDAPVAETAWKEAIRASRAQMDTAMAEADAHPFGPVTVTLVDSLFPDDGTVGIILTEREGLLVVTPNPFPPMIVVRRPHPWPHVVTLGRFLATAVLFVAGTALVLLGALLTAYYVTRALAR